MRCDSTTKKIGTMKKFFAKFFDFLNAVGKDKYQHFVLGGVIAFSLFSVALVILGDSKAAFWIAIGLSVAATVWSEVYKEYYLDEEADWWDMVATILGGIMVWASLLIGYSL